ncbi:MAG: peptide ABC transporter substrate-binding protein [Chloroflexota bacterium]
MKKRAGFKLLVCLLLLMMLPLSLGVVSAQDGKTLVTATGPGDPQSIDPQRASDQRSVDLSNILFPGLTTLDEETRTIVPGLASSWDISEDGLVYTFHLLENVPWVRYNADTEAVEQVMDENGNPRVVTAADLVYGWKRALDPATAAAGGYMLAPAVMGGVEYNSGTSSADDLGIRAVDDFTFEVTAPENVAYALGIYGLILARPAPQWAIDAAGDVWTEAENISSYGPFALKEWAHDDSITYVRNPFWPGSEGISPAHLDQLTLRFLEGSVQLREYEAGNIDVVPVVPSNEFDRISTDPVLSQELTIAPGMCSTAWNFNTTKAPFDNVHIRRAFTYAVDRQSLADNVFKGGRIPARWYTPPSVAFAPTLEDNPDLGIAFDAATAQEELQLGLTDLGLSSAADLPGITVDFGNSETNNSVGQALQVMWQATLGVNVTLNPMDTTTYWTIMGENSGQVHAGGWCPDYNDANNYTRDVLYSTSANNFAKWNNPEFDAIIDQARSSSDPDERRALYIQAEELMVVDQAATMPLVWESLPTLAKPYVTRTISSTGVQSYWKWDVNR